MLDCPDLSVPPDIMRHVVHVESANNPFAIGVVGGRLSRQPRNLPEALEAVRLLKEQGYNFSVGIAQVNRYNLARYGLKSYAEAFEVCPNLKAGSQILQECYGRAQDWGKAFSCYYSGNFVTGFQHGYVQKVFDSMERQGGGRAATGISVIPRAAEAQRQPARDDGVPLRRADIQGSGTPASPDTAASAAPPSAPQLPVKPPAAPVAAGIPVQVIGAGGNPYSVQVRPSRTVSPVRGGTLVESAGAATSSSASPSSMPAPGGKPQADAPAEPPADRSFVF